MKNFFGIDIDEIEKKVKELSEKIDMLLEYEKSEVKCLEELLKICRDKKPV